jgi:cyclin-dependent kinase
VIYKARDLAYPNRIVVLKKIRLETDGKDVLSTVLRVISLLKEMKDSNIVHLLNIVHIDGHKLYLVFEFLKFNLKKYMEALPVSNKKYKKAFPTGTKLDTSGLRSVIIKKFMN